MNRARVVEYVWFVREMKKQERAGRSGFIMLNSKIELFGHNHPRDAKNDNSGVTALKALDVWESTGKSIPCRQAGYLLWLKAGKAARDWHITQWGEGMAEGVTCAFELLADGVPASLVNAAKKARNSILFRQKESHEHRKL